MKIRFLIALVMCAFVLAGCPTPEGGQGNNRQTFRDEAEAKPDTNPDIREQNTSPSGARGGR